MNTQLEDNIRNILNEKITKIIPENIKAGVNIFDVVGNLSGGDVKLFPTEQAMQADPNPEEGDLAVVYREELTAVNENSEFDSCIFPDEVILDEAFSDSIYGSFRSTGSGWFDGMVDMSSSSFRFDGFGGTMIRVQYTSQDGITYTRTDGGEELQEFGTTIKYANSESWNSVIGNFMKISGNYYNGLYSYTPYINNTYIRCCADLFNIVKDGSFISNEQWAYNNPNLTGSWAVCQYTTSQYKDINFVTMTDGYSISTYLSRVTNGVVLVYDEYISKYFVGFCNSTSTPPASYNDIEVIHFYNNEKHTEHHSCTYFNTYITSKNYIYNLYIFDDIEISQNFVNHLAYYFSSGSGESSIGYLKINSNTNSIVEEPLYFYYVTDKFYHDMEYFLAKSQLDATNEYVFSKTFYGKNGVEIGTLTTNVSNLFADVNAKVYAKIQQQYDNMQPRVLTDQDKAIDSNIATIPCKTNSTPLLDTSNVTNMHDMFSGCKSLTTIPLLDTSNVTNMGNTFAGCSNLLTISLLDTSNVTDMSAMFGECTNLITMPLLDTSNVINMLDMFTSCKSLTTIPLLDTSNVTNMSEMFGGCTSLTTIPQLNTSNVIYMHWMFSYCTSLTTIPLLDTSNVTNMNEMFSDCTSLSDESLNNILAMCKNATKITSNKTLAYIGLTSGQAATCQGLSNYSAFIAAGWTTGY